jgi:hypothetical protein
VDPVKIEKSDKDKIMSTLQLHEINFDSVRCRQLSDLAKRMTLRV